jgi:hypothetical protein
MSALGESHRRGAACLDDFRALLAKHPEIVHVTVAVNRAVRAR